MVFKQYGHHILDEVRAVVDLATHILFGREANEIVDKLVALRLILEHRSHLVVLQAAGEVFYLTKHRKLCEQDSHVLCDLLSAVALLDLCGQLLFLLLF